MVAAIVERRLEVHHRITGQNTALQRFFDAVVDGVPVLSGDRPTHNLALKLVTGGGGQGFKLHPHMAKLSATTALPHKTPFGAHRVAKSLAISNLRPADGTTHLELALQSVHNDV